MERTEIQEKVKASITSVLGHDHFEMRDDLTAPDVEGWDSLTHMSIISGLEETFHIKFKLREINKLKNMGSLLQLIGEKTA